ncbi:unnamed protein product [Spirodela intermedia]|uniref:Transcription factor MYC/MYB N-terminal domain-containing protein n=1 Tax=Spirodela intermedia TaxID=51605 RepID=A0A7I8JEU6_SPIIN|nr:unnamed protein product [Spirodela intermedia]CAA6668674.1 unnamed protein product [Spirodela intermedia]
MGMVALHEALRNVCRNSDWTYSVFWTIRPRPRCRGGNGCKVGDDNGRRILPDEGGGGGRGEDPVRKAFSKMSIQLYNYGEGLMGKVASDKCHKWVFKQPSASFSSDCEPNVANYWQSSFDALPPEWTDQFASGIQTIAVIQAGHGLLQLGSCKIVDDPDIKWPTGLSFFNALTARADDAELLFGGGATGDALGTKAAGTSHHRVVLGGYSERLLLKVTSRRYSDFSCQVNRVLKNVGKPMVVAACRIMSKAKEASRSCSGAT